MMTLKDLETETLQAETLIVGNLTAQSINGITQTELSYLKGSTGSIQDKLTKLSKDSNNLLNGWK